MKKILPLILVIVVILVVALLWSKGEFKTYENSRYSFSVDYPADWTLGKVPTNNDGRVFTSPDSEIECRAYGFQNVLMNENGDPQTLDDFVDWLIDYPDVEVLERNYTNMSGQTAEELINKTKEGVSQGVYILGTESGRGLVCYYSDIASKDSFQETFKKMKLSFNISVLLDPEENQTSCSNYLSGVLTPLKTEQFIDDKYTEVTITSRNAWDRSRLPQDVTRLEGLGYACNPIPLEFEGGEKESGIMVEPTVTKVEWNCELEYEDWKYLEGNDAAGKQVAEKAGFICEKEKCFADGPMVNDAGVWLCTK